MAVTGGYWISGLLAWSRAQLGPSKSTKAFSYFLALSSAGVSMLKVFLNWHHRKHDRSKSNLFLWRDLNHILYRNSHVNPLPTGHKDE
ncbi:unnamed protein product [Nyctereutes procyonoides]|uniref:(raccoon dog) hypothetical protein n=1 Tax=Nyctereutes procyonoides TaxID=34880 RepID=A0A811ZI00_NYCPR|nr:unnamed protein product [Nyctereutes procyonoides]